MSQTFNARGTYSDISVIRNDSALKTALRRLGKEGEHAIDGFLNLLANEQVANMKEQLKSKAGTLASVRVPSPKGLPYGKSKNIYVKVADALKVHKMAKMEYKVHTGKNIQDAEVGVLGQRGGKIAHIISKGMNSFKYGNLPMLVMSSTRWYKSTGQAGWPSVGMRMRMTHPGFTDTIDFIGEIEKKMVSEFELKSHNAIFGAAIRAGFTIEEASSMGGGSASASAGGTGIMSARR